MPIKEINFAEKIKNSIGWNTLSVLAKITSEFGVRIGLAKLLTPEDFGIYYYCLAIISIISILPAAGLQPALIQRPSDERSESVHQSAFALISALSVIIFLTVYFGVDFGSYYFAFQPEVIYSIKLIALTILLIPFSTLNIAVLSRNMMFNQITKAEVLSLLLFLILTYVLVLLNYKYESLVIAFIVSQIFRVLILIKYTSFVPSLYFNFQDLKLILEKSKFFLFGALTAAFRLRSDVLLLGTIMGTSSLGVYTFAFAITDSLQSQISAIVNKTMFPVYSQLNSDKEARKSYYLKVTRYIALVMFPFYICMFFLADIIVNNFLSQDWVDSIILIKLLSIASLVYSVGGYPSEILNASGRPDVSFKISFYNYIFVALPMLALFTYLWGTIGAAISIILHYCTLRISHFMALKNILSIGFLDILKATFPALILSICLTLILGLNLF